jgi:hypothetical protein
MAAFAAITERVTIGPLVACLGFHSPALLAKMAASIDEVSGGRFVLAIGSGWNEAEFSAFGIPFDRKVSRFEEACAIVRPLLEGGRATHGGPSTGRRTPCFCPSRSVACPSWRASTAHARWASPCPGSTRGTRGGGATETLRTASRGSTPGSTARATTPAAPGRRSSGPRACWSPSTAGPVSARITACRPRGFAGHLRELADAGADEAILVLDPITRPCIEAIAAQL